MSLPAWICGLVIALSSLGAGAALAIEAAGPSPAADGVPAAAPLLRLADVAPPPPEPREAVEIDGRWKIGSDALVELADGKFTMFSNGAPVQQGTYTLDGDIITSRSAAGDMSSGRVTRQGDVILLEPDDGVPMLMRAETPSAAAPADPAGVEGRWRTAHGDYLELTGGRALYREAPSQEPDVGSYRFEGGELVLTGPGGDETRGSWVTVGERLVIEAPGGDLMVLSPEGGVTSAPPAAEAPAAVELADVAPPPDGDAGAVLPAAATAVDGRWRLGDDVIIAFAGGRYEVYENGEAAETGTFRVEGDTITLAEGNASEENTARFTLGADLLLLEGDDMDPMVLRAETASGTAPLANPADLVGRWRTSEDDVVEVLPDGRYVRADGAGDDEGRYRIEGDFVIFEEGAGGRESRMRWFKLADRVILEMTDDDEVIILTPEADSAAAPAPEPGPQVSELMAEIPAAEIPAAEVQPVTSDDPVTEPAVDSTVVPASSSVLDGRWIMGPGKVIAFGDGRYEVIENGQAQVNGTFTIEGDTLLLRRDTDPEGQIRRSRYTREGDAMLIEPEGDDPAVLFAETPSGSAIIPDPHDLEGRWRTVHGDLIELRDGRYAYVGEDGGTQRGGTYAVDGDALTMRPEIGRETAGRWARIGARIAIQVDDGQVVILTPEPATAQLPQVPAVATAETPTEAPPVETTTGAGETPPQLPPPAPQPQQPPPPAQPQGPLSGPPPLPVTPEPPPLIPPVGRALSDGTPLGEQWAGYLKAKRMAQGVGQPMVQVLDLCSDGQYFWLVGHGTAMPQPQGTGYWSIVTQGQVASLQLTPVGAPPGALKLDFDGQSAYLNGVPTQVLQMNQSCP